QSVVRYFSVDTGSPEITIITPVQDTFFGVSPPSFEITIIEPNLNTTWYTLNNGETNTTFTGLSGTIDTTVWDPIVADDVIIRFYANDSFGHEGYAEVAIKKDLNAPDLTIVQDDLTFTVTAVDGSGSGVNSINYRINGSAWMQYTTPFTLDYGRYNITTRAIDEVGNIGYGGLIINLSEPDIPDDPFDWTIIIMSTVIVGGIGLIVVITLLIKKRK
ncbi:MAG: OmpL47-type beta-barrel domain-containing protein, partial [Promethearchaeota archaeon]